MIGTVTLYRTKGSRSCNQYPYIHGTARPTQAVSYDRMKFTEDTVQDVTVKEFDDWTWYNLAELKSEDGAFDEFYWITGASRSSTVQGAVTLNLYWNAPTTVAYKRIGITGEWQSFPTQTSNPNARVVPVAGQNVPQRFTEFPDSIPAWTDNDGNSHRVAWVSFTTTSTPNCMFGRGGQTYTRGGQTVTVSTGGKTPNDGYFIVADAEGFNIYGFPILLDQFDNPSSADHVGVAVISDSGDVFIRNAPTIYDVMSRPDIIGFQSGDIADLSFSFACPFGLEFYGTSADLVTGGTRPVYLLRLEPDTPIFTETQLNDRYNSVPFVSTEPNSDEGEPCFFICRGYTGTGNGEYRAWLQGIIPTETTYESSSIAIDSRFEQSVQIRDYSGTLMQDIPLDMFTVDASTATATLPYTEHVHCDYDGMFRHIIIGDADSDANMQIVLNEPKLPRTASSWQDYRQGAMRDDRNAVISNLAFSVAGTAVGGGIGLAGIAGATGIGAVGRAMSEAAQVEQTFAYATPGAPPHTGGKMYVTNQPVGSSVASSQLRGSIGQQLGGGIVGAVQGAYGQYTKERAIQRQPNTVVSMGYGLGQVIVSMEYPPGFMVSYPRGTLNDEYEDANLKNAPVTNYIERHGYPVQTIIATMLATGYYQGIAYSSDELSGAKLDELNNCLMQGVQMVGI